MNNKPSEPEAKSTRKSYAKKIGILGKTIDVLMLAELRGRLGQLLVIEQNEVYELYALRGKDAKTFLEEPDEYPYLLLVSEEESNASQARIKLVRVLKKPIENAEGK